MPLGSRTSQCNSMPGEYTTLALGQGSHSGSTSHASTTLSIGVATRELTLSLPLPCGLRASNALSGTTAVWCASLTVPLLQVDLVSGQGLGEVFQQHGPIQAVINCAAVSQPGRLAWTPCSPAYGSQSVALWGTVWLRGAILMCGRTVGWGSQWGCVDANTTSGGILTRNSTARGSLCVQRACAVPCRSLLQGMRVLYTVSTASNTSRGPTHGTPTGPQHAVWISVALVLSWELGWLQQGSAEGRKRKEGDLLLVLAECAVAQCTANIVLWQCGVPRHHSPSLRRLNGSSCLAWGSPRCASRRCWSCLPRRSM